MSKDDVYLREHIKKLIELDNEEPKIDSKRTLDITTRGNKAELIKDIIAITNSEPINDPTGYYIIGAKHKQLFDISSLKLDDATLQQIINSKCHKPIDFQYKQFSIEDKTIGVIVIPKSDKKPHLVSEDYFDDHGNKLLQRGTCFIRKGSSTSIATKEDYDLMYEEQIQKRVKENIEYKKHQEWLRAPKGLTERLADMEIRKQVTLQVYNNILKEIDLFFKKPDIKTKEQLYYELRQNIESTMRAKEAENYFRSARAKP